MPKDKTAPELYKEIEQLKSDLEKAQTAYDIAVKQSPERQLAIELHNLLCTHDHTEYCGWYYEISNDVHDWTRWTHERYLTKAKEVLVMCEKLDVSSDFAISIIKAVKGYNEKI